MGAILTHTLSSESVSFTTLTFPCHFHRTVISWRVLTFIWGYLYSIILLKLNEVKPVHFTFRQKIITISLKIILKIDLGRELGFIYNITYSQSFFNYTSTNALQKKVMRHNVALYFLYSPRVKTKFLRITLLFI